MKNFFKIKKIVPLVIGTSGLFSIGSIMSKQKENPILTETKKSRPIDFNYFNDIDKVGGWTFLHDKAYKGELIEEDITDLTIEELDIRDGFGQSPLFWAVESGRLDIVEILLEKGADAKQTDNLGRTLFHVTSSPQLVPILIKYGVDYNQKDNSGNTTIDELNRRSSIYNYETERIFQNKQRVLVEIQNYEKSKF